MPSLVLILLLSILATVFGLPHDEITAELGPLLSANASIIDNTAKVPRWSEFSEPKPGIVVNVATEHDVAVTACYSIWHFCLLGADYCLGPILHQEGHSIFGPKWRTWMGNHF